MAEEQKEAAASPVKVRVLIAHEAHLPNHVITLSAAEAKVAKRAGWADDDAAGIEYAEANEPQPQTAA